MNMNWLSKILNWIKIPIKILLPALTIFSGFVMLSSEDLLSKLYLLDMKKENGFSFGLIFILCLSLIISYAFVLLIEKIINKIRSLQLKRKLKKNIDSLPKKAFDILVKMYKTVSHSMELDFSYANTVLLENYQMIGRGYVSSFGTYFSYFLQPWVSKYFDERIVSNKKEIKRIEKRLLIEQNDENKEALSKRKRELEKKIKSLSKKVEYKTLQQRWFESVR